MKGTRKYTLFVLVMMIPAILCAQETYDSLLSGYIQNDMRLKELSISLEQAQISYQKTCINNEMTYQVSTGSVSLEAGTNTFGFSIRPEASATVPDLDNLSLSLSAPVSIRSSNGKTTASLSDAGITASKDIISTASETTAINMEKAERSLLEAERKLAARKLALEKEFLNALKNLFSARSSALKAQSTLLDKQDSLRNLKLQGYAETSSKYRTALLEESSANRKLEEAERTFNAQLASFCDKCSVETLDITAIEIPEEELVSISSFNADSYTDLESAVWSHYINGRTRANTTELTLSANGGLSFSASTDEKSDSYAALKGGVTATYKSFSASANLSVPVGSDTKNPSLTLSLTWKPSTERTKELDEQSTALTSRMEELSIEQARSSFEEQVTTYETKRDNLLWQLESGLEELSMYQELAADTKKWYDQGYLTESDYKSSVTKYEDAKASIDTIKLDFLIYNRDVQSLFIQEDN